MKKKWMFSLMLVVCLLFTACGSSASQIESDMVKTDQAAPKMPESSAEEGIATEKEGETAEPADRRPMVMVKGVLYYDANQKSTAEGRCGVLDGEITSCVDMSQVPMKDDQSNFGSGYGYQYGVNGTIEICMDDGEWYVFTQNEDGTVDTIEEVQEDICGYPLQIREIVMENPSWEYYIYEPAPCDEEAVRLTLLEKTANQITDAEQWFEKNQLNLQQEDPEEHYHCYIEGDEQTVSVLKNGDVTAVLDFSEFRYSADSVPEDMDYVDQKVWHTIVDDDVLYVSTFHYTYSESAPSNGYITAIDLNDFHIIWKSAPQVCNSRNFWIEDDVIFCGYGFTSEPDYLYQLDQETGVILARQELKSMADYVISKNDKLYVRTYDTDYVFDMED